MEIEAESASHLVCKRSGISTHSAEYLSSYLKGEKDLKQVSLDMIIRAASRIEKWGQKLNENKMAKKLKKKS